MTRRRIAVVVSDVFLRRLTPALFPSVREGIDYWMIDIMRPAAELQRLLKNAKPAGVITEEMKGKTGAVLKLGFPTVIADSDVVYPGAISIDVDDWAIGRRVAEFLQGRGQHHFAFVGNGMAYSGQREEGFRRALSGAGFSVESFVYREVEGGSYMEHYRGQARQLKRWLKGLPRPLAIFAAHDPLGRVLCEVCEECGWLVPDEISVVGANNDELLCHLSHPPLSSVAIPWAQIGALAVKLLNELIAERQHAGEGFLLQPGDVVARESSDFAAVDDPLVKQAMKLIREQYQTPLLIAHLCEQLCVSRRSLELRFKETVGLTPRQALEKQRVNRAKELLASSHLKMEWIARQSGFTDAERLSVVFRKVAGETPSAYRKRMSRAWGGA